MRIIKRKKIVDASVRPGLFTTIISSFCYTGYAPAASGTVASFAALLIFVIKDLYHPLALSILIVFFFVSGIYTSKVMMKKYGDDPSVVVIDEAVGVWLTVLILILMTGTEPSIFYLFICFITFRLFDILKIQPAKYFDTLHSPFGVMMDDVIAGIYAGFASYAIHLTGFDPF